MQQRKRKKEEGPSHVKATKKVAHQKNKKCNKKLGFRVKLVPMLVGSRFFHFFIYFSESPSYIRG